MARSGSRRFAASASDTYTAAECGGSHSGSRPDSVQSCTQVSKLAVLS